MDERITKGAIVYLVDLQNCRAEAAVVELIRGSRVYVRRSDPDQLVRFGGRASLSHQNGGHRPTLSIHITQDEAWSALQKRTR